MVTGAMVEAALAVRIDEGVDDPEQVRRLVEEGNPIVAETRAMLEAAERAAWMPIETAPRDGEGVLLLVPDPDRAEVAPGYSSDGVWLSWSAYEVTPTHWRPLPLPPEPGREGSEA